MVYAALGGELFLLGHVTRKMCICPRGEDYVGQSGGRGTRQQDDGDGDGEVVEE